MMSNTATAAEIVRATVLNGMQQDRCSCDTTCEERSKPITEMQASQIAAPSRFNVLIALKDGRSLAYNTQTSSFAVWTAAEVASYRRVERGELHMGEPDLKDFVTAGYIVPAEVDQIQAFEEIYKGARFDPFRMIVTIAPTTSCNFACDYCFQGVDKPNTKMSEEVQDAFIEFLAKRLPRLKSLSIVWFGGEPLMGMAIIRRLSRRMLILCRKARVKYDAFIVTNGYFLDAKVARELYSLRVTSCQVTFDGPAAHHDQRRHLTSGRPTFEHIVENLRQVLDEVPMQVSVRVNIDERNAGGVRNLLDDFVSRGFSKRQTFGVYFAPIEAITESCQSCAQVEIGKSAYARMEAELYRYAVERGLCGLPKPSLFIGNCQAVRPNGLLLAANGDIHKCWDTMHDPELKVGTIFAPDKLAEHPLFKRWMEWTPFENNVCRNCKILPICSGFCGYKFVHPNRTHGEAGVLPCPSWKFNFNERIFLRAEKMGMVRLEDIADEDLLTTAAGVGANHNMDDFSSISGYHRPFPIPVVAHGNVVA